MTMICECGRVLTPQKLTWPDLATHELCPCGLQWYWSGGTVAACEDFYVRHGQGVTLAAEHGAGTVEYYEALIAGVELAHSVGMCPI